MATNEKKEKVTFTASRVVSKPAVISFHTKDGKVVEFKGHKDVPKPVKVTFFAKKK